MITKFVGFYRGDKPDIITGLTSGEDIYGMRQGAVRHSSLLRAVLEQGVPLEDVSVCGIFDMETGEVLIDARASRAMDDALVYEIIRRHLRHNPIYKRIRLEKKIPAAILKAAKNQL